MKIRKALVSASTLLLLVATIASAKDKNKHAPRGMIESMQSVPCGVKEHGITGLGTVWASAGIHHTNADEKLCAQYLFRTDEMDYHIRPEDMKHAVLLPVGHEGEFKIKKNRLYLKIPDGDKKTRSYQVVSMEPAKSETARENTSYRSGRPPAEGYRRAEDSPNKQANSQPTATPPPQ